MFENPVFMLNNSTGNSEMALCYTAILTYKPDRFNHMFDEVGVSLYRAILMWVGFQTRECFYFSLASQCFRHGCS